jgi:hypothetical protein
MESVRERIKREWPVAEKMLPMTDPERLRRQKDEELNTAWAWIQVSRRLGRRITERELASINI